MRWVSFIAGIKSGLSTLVRFFPSTFLIALWPVWCETSRIQAWALMDLRGFT
uniref:Uncharacterized protein n=1 Tax=Lepeophtheirus salmonis TaxID=72036 RepID=A0A0K2VIC9_LEPSM